MYDWTKIAAELRAQSQNSQYRSELLAIADCVDLRDIGAAIDLALQLPTEPEDLRTKYCARLGYRVVP